MRKIMQVFVMDPTELVLLLVLKHIIQSDQVVVTILLNLIVFLILVVNGNQTQKVLVADGVKLNQFLEVVVIVGVVVLKQPLLVPLIVIQLP